MGKRTWHAQVYLSIALLLTSATAGGENQIDKLTCERFLDYTNSPDAIATPWYSVNDNVMGGRSLGSFRVVNQSLNFFGSINTNGGGFASIRHELKSNLFNESDRIRLSIQSDGRPYSVNIRDKASSTARIAHRSSIKTAASKEFQTVEVLFSDLVPTFRGRIVKADQFNPNEALSISLMLSDVVDGPFALNIQWIDVCGVKAI